MSSKLPSILYGDNLQYYMKWLPFVKAAMRIFRLNFRIYNISSSQAAIDQILIQQETQIYGTDYDGI
ncbi:hypothetical protein QUB47_22615 [Microcoleus sp. AT9_B5]